MSITSSLGINNDSCTVTIKHNNKQDSVHVYWYIHALDTLERMQTKPTQDKHSLQPNHTSLFNPQAQAHKTQQQQQQT